MIRAVKRLLPRRLPLLLVLFAVATTLWGTVVSPVLAAPKTLKLHHTGRDAPLENPAGTMARVFKSLVEAGTAGEIRVNIFANSVLGKDSDVLTQVKNGGIQSGIHTLEAAEELYPLLRVLETPFVLHDDATAAAVYDGPFGRRLAKDMEAESGLKILGFGDSGGFVHLSSAKKALNSAEDVRGLRLGVTGGESCSRLVRRLDAQPVPMQPQDLFTALQNGSIDGVAATASVLAASKAGEAQNHLTLANTFMPPSVWVMNKGFWDSLSAREKTVVAYAARAAILAGRGQVRAMEAGLLPSLQKTMKTNMLLPEEQALFRAADSPDQLTDAEKSFLAALQAAVEAAGMFREE